MKKNYNISVVLPCYNGENTLEKCLESINKQDCKIELIFIDDGSSDTSLHIFKNFKFNIKCTIKIISRNNKGFLFSLDEGVRHASGDYIARIDADDIWFDNHLDLIMNEFYKDESIVLVGSQAIKIDDNFKILGSYNVPHSQKDIIKLLHSDSAFIHSSVVFKKSAYDMTQGYLIGDDIISMHISDFNLWFELSKLGTIMNLSNETIYYRISNLSMSRKINKFINYKGRYIVMKKVHNYYQTYFLYSFLQKIKVKLRIMQYYFHN
jgi:glycosyltransferase involved in cell wall biosynthesis